MKASAKITRQRAATTPTVARGTEVRINSNGYRQLRAAVAAQTGPGRLQPNTAAPASPTRLTRSFLPPPPPEDGSPDFDAHAESSSCYYDPSDAGTVVMSYSGIRTRAASTASMATAAGAVHLQPHAPLPADDVAEVSEFEEFDAIVHVANAAETDVDVDMTAAAVPTAAVVVAAPRVRAAPKRKSVQLAARARSRESSQEADRKKKQKNEVKTHVAKGGANAPLAIVSAVQEPSDTGAIEPHRARHRLPEIASPTVRLRQRAGNTSIRPHPPASSSALSIG